ncbi:MAG: hypothetical protein D3914_02510, partial [Candidatus Electrothrix sp. LOE2]|nr:hypothetical protein [Candidatus Electrothrix sp. LOE2]
MEKIPSTGSSFYRQSLPVQDRPCNNSAVISIRDQGGLDLIRLLLDQGRDVCIKVSGESMKPILHTGDSVQISSLAGQSPKIGEILLLCDQQGNPLIHRLIRRRYCKGVLCLQTKGDACLGFDGFVPAGQVIGRIRRITYHSDTTTLQRM